MNPRDKETAHPPVPPTNRADKGKRILESESSQSKHPALHIGHLFRFSKSKVDDEITILKLVNEFLYHNPEVDISSKLVQLHQFIKKNTWEDVNQSRLTDIISNLEKDYWRIVDENGDIRAGEVERSFNPYIFVLSEKIWGEKEDDDQNFFDDGNFLFKSPYSSFQDNVCILKFLVCLRTGGKGFDPFKSFKGFDLSKHFNKVHEFIVKTGKEYVSATIMSHRLLKLEKIFRRQAELNDKNTPHHQTNRGKILYQFSEKIWGSKDDDQEVILPEDPWEMEYLDLPDDKAIMKWILEFMKCPPASWCDSLYFFINERAKSEKSKPDVRSVEPSPDITGRTDEPSPKLNRARLLLRILRLESTYELTKAGKATPPWIFDQEDMELAGSIWGQKTGLFNHKLLLDLEKKFLDIDEVQSQT